jgi:glutamate dehydrogenase (NADP+)
MCPGAAGVVTLRANSATAIQNELDLADAQRIVDNGYRYVIETSNMGCTLDAIAHLQSAGIGFAPGKAANAGGVAVSGLEMWQDEITAAEDAAEQCPVEAIGND